MLRLDKLSFASRERQILNGVTSEILDNALTCLIGVNGAGKTTLLRLLIGELKASSGTFYIDSVDAAPLSPKEIAKYFAVIPQGIQPPHDFTVSELVALGCAPNRALWSRLNAQEHGSVQGCITRCDVSQFSQRRVEELSGGEQRRAWLAFALAQRKRYLLLDETLDGLDSLAKQSFFKLLKQVASEGKGILLTTHDLDLVTHFADKVIVLSGGMVSYQGPPVPDLQDLLLPASA